jgi:predicted Zn-dependent protease
MSEQKALIDKLKNSESEDDRKQCIPLLQEYLKTKPDDAVAWYDLACCYDFCGLEKEAEPCYWKTYNLGWQALPESEHGGFFVGFGSTLRNNLDFVGSEKILKDAVKNFPTYPALKVFLAFTLYSQGKYQEAAQILFAATLEMPEKAYDGYERAIKWYVENLATHPVAVAPIV